MVRHNNIRGYGANLLAKIHTDVETETSLQSIEGEIVNGYLVIMLDPTLGLGVYREMVRTRFLMF